MKALFNLSILALFASARVAASTNGAGVDTANLQGKALVTLNHSAMEGAAQTSDVKLQHSDDNATWVDTGYAFPQVTTAGGAKLATLLVDADRFKKFVRVVSTLGGAGAACTYGVTVANYPQQ